MSKIILVIANEGYQPIEYGVPRQMLLAAGHTVITASDLAGTAVAKDMTTAKVDMLVGDAVPSAADALFLIGGSGALAHLDNETAHEIVRQWAASGKLFGAICISPRILAHAGVLTDKKATGWNNDGELDGVLSAAGAVYVPSPVVIDGSLITADGPEHAAEFGQAILEKLA